MKENIMKRKKVVIGAVVAIVVILVIVLIGCFAGYKASAGDKKDLVVQSNLEMTEVNVLAQIAGQVVELNVKEGDLVQEGDVVAKVSSDTLMTQKMQAEAGIKAIEGQISSAQAGYQKVLNGTQDEVIAQAKASYDLQTSTYQRIKTLYENGGVSKAEYDGALTQYEVAKQKYLQAKNGSTAEDKKMAASSVATLQGQLEAAYASLAEIQTYLDKTVIVAPATGIITQLNAEQGELISSGLPLAVITDTSAPWIQCNVMENDLGKVELGQKVTIELGAYPDQVYEGKVVAINKNADFAVKKATNANGEFDILSYGVKVQPTKVDESLFAGMTAFVNFSAKERKNK